MKHTIIIAIFILLLASCASPLTGNDVITAFKNAGLEAENPHQMTKDEYGLAPYVCVGTRFLIPALGADNGGRIFICTNREDQDLLVNYYKELGRQSAAFYSWVFVKNNIVVQINGDLPEVTARKYEVALP